ncbi:MAG: hypothetical protein ABIK36_00140 [Pseudomonadota bacterium]
MHALLRHSPLRNLLAGWQRSRAIPAANGHTCATCNGQRRTFICPNWPTCGCPEGTTLPACPGRSVACSCPSFEAAGAC